MSSSASDGMRVATAADTEQLLALWALLFDEIDSDSPTSWRQHARVWFARFVTDQEVAVFPLIDVGGKVVATAVGVLELGIPNPYCPHGRVARLANVITAPGHRGKGYATLLVREVVAWARAVAADRVDLSATPDAQHLYHQLGFDLTTAPRMKLVLP